MSDPKKPTSQAELMGGHLGTFHRQPEERKHAPAEQAPVDAFQASNIAGMWAVGEVAEKLIVNYKVPNKEKRKEIVMKKKKDKWKHRFG